MMQANFIENVSDAFNNFKLKSQLKTLMLPVALCSTDNNIYGDTSMENLPGFQIHKNDINKQHLHSEVGQYDLVRNETGLDRLKILYSFRYATGFIQEDVQNMNSLLKKTISLGAFFSLFASCSVAYANKLQKNPQNQSVFKILLTDSSFTKEIVKETVKLTARMTCFAGIIIYVSQTITAYRNKSSVFEYGAATALAFAFKDYGQGLKVVARSSATGALVGIAGGYVACSLLMTSGWSQEQRNFPRRLKYLNAQET